MKTIGFWVAGFLGGAVLGLAGWVVMIAITGSMCALPGVDWGCSDPLASGGPPQAPGGNARTELTLWDWGLLVAMPIGGGFTGANALAERDKRRRS